MVGALSIVRFRTAMKDPMDIAFYFGRLPVVSPMVRVFIMFPWLVR